MLQNTDLTNVLLIDIETVPQYATFREMPAHFQQLWELKTKYQRREETPEDFYPRAGILAEFGKVICISCGRLTLKNSTYSLRIKSFSGHDEARLLEEFSALLNSLPISALLCAHNGKEFDFPYLGRRMLINGLTLPPQLQLAGKKPWEVPHLDTMDLWKFGDYKHFTSLNLLAAIFNVPTPKEDMDGSNVYQVYYVDKDLDRIVNYCQKDVVTTAQILLKFKGIANLTEENITIVG